MTKHIGHVGLVALLLLTLTAPFFSSTYAQEEDTVVIAGSTYLEDLLRELVEDYKANNKTTADFLFSAEGINAGIEALCAGDADLVMSTRSITDEELLNCDNNFIEVLIAVEGLILVPDTGVSQDLVCISSDNLPNILSAGANEELTWLDVSTTYDSNAPLTLYGPSEDITTFVASLLPSEQARDTYETFDTLSDILTDLQSAGSNTLAFTTLAAWDALSDDERGDVKPFEIAPQANFIECSAPTVEAVESGDYALGRRLLLYVNPESATEAPVASLLDYILSDDVITSSTTALGYSAPTANALERGLANIADSRLGRTFTRANTPVIVNTAEPGELNIAGASAATYATEPVFTAFNETFTAVDVNINALGNAAGWEAFCSGESTVIQVTRPATEDELAACEENNIEPTTVFLGADAVVLLVDADNASLPTCVNEAEIRTLIVNENVDVDAGRMNDTDQAADDEDNSDDGDVVGEAQGPTDWGAVGGDTSTPLLILPPSLGALETDIILTSIAPGEALLRRTDAPTVQEVPTSTTLSSVDYRIGGLPNFDGGALTWTFYSEWMASENADSVRAFAVGEDCINPSEEAILDGTYPFVVASYLVFSGEALGDTLPASLLWLTYDDDTLDRIAELNLVGFDREAFDSARDALFNSIAEAQQARLDAEETAENQDDAASEETNNTEADEDTATSEDASDTTDSSDSN